MTKQTTETLPAMDDFMEDDGSFLDEIQEETEESEEKEESEEEEEEESEPDKKKKKDKGSEESEEEESEEEEEEPEPKKKTKKKQKASDDDDEEEEDSEEDSEEDEEEEEESTEASSEFWQAVEKITGNQVEVDYDGVDPLSPDGVAIREDAIRLQTRDGLLAEMQAKFPKTYKSLQYESNGGDPAELFSSTEPDYSKMEIKEDDVDGQKTFLKQYYMSKKGLTESKANKLLETSEDSDELFSEAKEVLKELKDAQVKDQASKLERAQVQEQELVQNDNKLITTVDKAIGSGTLNTFKVRKAETDEFRNAVIRSLRRSADGKGHNIVIPVDPENIEQQLQMLFFNFKKGDLGKIVQVAATTEKTKEMKLGLKKTKRDLLGKDSAEEKAKKRKNNKNSELEEIDEFMED